MGVSYSLSIENVSLLTISLLSDEIVSVVGRHIITIIMTALALLCPSFPCGECSATCPVRNVAETEANIESNESCCGRCQDSNEHQVPIGECPSDCEQVLNCFCGGAILPTGTVCPGLGEIDVTASLLSSASESIQAQIALHAQSMLFSSNRCSFPSFASGRDLCALTGSYLL